MNKIHLLKKKRVERNLTQEYIASQMSISTKTLSRIENQKRPIKLHELRQICDLLNLDPNMFIETEEEASFHAGEFIEPPTPDYGKYLSPEDFISEIKNIEFKLLVLKGKLYKELKERF